MPRNLPFDLYAGIGPGFWSSGINGTAKPSFVLTVAGGYSFGLVFGGLMTGIGWRWTFLLPVPIALAALAAW